jgi:4-hydroxy-3-methylbut-2-enyl diphosphate reductase
LVRRLVACIQQRYAGSDVRFVDTVCRPTKQRQTAAIDLARQADVVIVVGGASSNNTRSSWRRARYCARVHHVQTDADLCVDWFRGAETVGLTAGTSTPDDVVDRVESRIRTLVPGENAGVRGRLGVTP